MAVTTRDRFSTLAETTSSGSMTNVATTLAVTSRSAFSQADQFFIVVQDADATNPSQPAYPPTNREIMLVTAGFGSGAGSFTVTRAQEGTTAVAHASGSYVAQVATAKALSRWVPDYVFQPRHQQWIAGPNTSPMFMAGTPRVPTTLVPYVMKVWFPEDVTVTNIQVYQTSAAATLTSGSNRLGLYTVSGTTATLQQQTATITWAGANTVNTVALASPVNVTGGPGVFGYLALLSSATTPAGFTGSNNGSQTQYQLGLAASDGYNGGKLTAVSSGSGLPASFTYTTGISIDFLYYIAAT